MNAPRRGFVCSVTLLGGLLVAAPAAAVYQCGDQTDDCQCGKDNPFPCCSNGGNCTWWAWEDACCTWGVGIPAWGNANTWGSNASVDPNYQVLDSPVVNSIATSTAGYYGHVAFVTAVNGSNITVREMNCCSTCNDGVRTWTYQGSFFNSGFVVRTNPCACSSGQTQTDQSGCQNCAERSRGCSDGCHWDSWGACQGGGECSAGAQENEGCGTHCGQHTRTCNDSCSWGAWGDCQNEGPCSDGETGSEACGPCQVHTRTCEATCQWGAWGACAGPDLDAGKVPCDTGLLGVCKAGTLHCEAEALQCVPLREPSAEVCDNLDNDCNGTADDGLINCNHLGPPAAHLPDAGSAGAGGEGGGQTANGNEKAGCGCSTTPSTLPPWAALLGGLAALFLERRRRLDSSRNPQR